ncbi:hypothetical protein K1T71_005212 [Dendrolimus kikuchii]|uniref:Uncharacterized protein n=1 Tax=Dendrolimus kikuchii TaxID=765133 RepID=A0ACC1D6R0_9NEOP|nr:hypothetical protein K1T71_005212 [Dendrolimus kikuchii]
MFRTPAKTTKLDKGATSPKTSPDKQAEIYGSPLTGDDAGPSRSPMQDNRKIGERDNGGPSRAISQPHAKAVTLTFSPPIKGRATSVEPFVRQHNLGNKTYTKVPTLSPISGSSNNQGQPESRIQKARRLRENAKTQLGNSKNLKTEIKNAFNEALDTLYKLLVEAEEERKRGNEELKRREQVKDLRVIAEGTGEEEIVTIDESPRREKRSSDEEEKAFRKQLEEHSKMLLENSRSMKELKEMMEGHREEIREARNTYASVAAKPKEKPIERATLHSVVITATNGEETGDELMTRVRTALNAKEGGVEIERVRRAKDRKVIVGCRTREERERVKERLNRDKDNLQVEEIKNKDPLVEITGVLKVHKDEEIYSALLNQNRRVFEGLGEEDRRMQIAFKIQGRNPHTHRVIMRVAPKLWKRLTDTGTVRIDLQNLHVVDKSPLVQCTQCLGYGHGKKICTEVEAKCSHCSGPHYKSMCPEYMAGMPPSCINCAKAKKQEIGHNAFDGKCPIRMKWDALARAAVAYC